MQKPWLTQYPEGIPTEIDISAFASLADFVENICAKHPQSPAFSNLGATLSYRQLEEKTRAFANFLHHDLKLKKGERIAIMTPNLLQSPIAIFGALRAGLIVVNTNPLYKPRELKHQLSDSGASVILVLENFAHVVADVLPDVDLKAVIITRMGDLLSFPKAYLVNAVVKHVKKLVPAYDIPDTIDFKDALIKGAARTYKPVPANHEDIAFLQYTGGTTGLSKGAMLTHKNMLANMQQATQWLLHTSPKDAPIEIGGEIVITALPLYHVFALLANCLVFMNLGGLNHLITNPRDIKGFVKELKKTRFTCMTGVNTLFNGLLNDPHFESVDFSSLKIVLGGGMAVQEAVARRWKQVTGTTLIEAYGLTETSPAVCINPIGLPDYNGSIGLPLSSTDCCIQDEQNSILPLDETGELCVRGPQVMKGYWNQPEETAKTFSEGGWLHTGDIARFDDKGFVYLVDRKKDMILVSGFNVYPNEIEAVLAEHPGVLECGAIGVPDEQCGEVVKIVVVRKDPLLDETVLQAYCRENLTGYKRPKYIEFRDELPKTNVGKILRRELRDNTA